MDNQINNLSHIDFLSSVKLRQQRELLEPAGQNEDRDEEISGAQFLCKALMRSLTLEEAPDHRPLSRLQQSTCKPKGECLFLLQCEREIKEEKSYLSHIFFKIYFTPNGSLTRS